MKKGLHHLRGQFQGKAVRRCKKCGVGLFVGPFSGGFFGKPKQVPSDLWERMLEAWQREFESDSPRESVPINQIAHDVAEMTVEASSLEKISEAVQAALKAEKPPNIDNRMRNEWLIFIMFASTYGMESVAIHPDVKRNIQDQFHYFIYHAEFPTDDERAAFEQSVRDRYTTYWAILNKQDANMFEELGRSF